MTQEEIARRQWYSRMMNVTARGYTQQVARQIAAGSGRANPWKWTAVRNCPAKLLEVLNSDNVPFLQFHLSQYAPGDWKGFWTLDSIRFDDWKFDLQLEYGIGDEKSVQLTFDGFQPPDAKNPCILPVVIATKKAFI